MSEIEKEIFELWKEMNPNAAYLQGLSEYAGKMFIPTPENEKRITDRIESLLSKTDDPVERKFLISLKASIKYHEAPHDISDIVWTLFGHMIKEGFNVAHLSSLVDHGRMKLENSKNTYLHENLPLITRIILTNKCNGLEGFLKIITTEVHDDELKNKIEQLIKDVEAYREIIKVEGIEKGDFSEVFPIISKTESTDMGREDFYPQLITELYDYYETPQEIEEKALSWIDFELPKLKESAERLAEHYGVEPDINIIDTEITKRSNIRKSELLDFILNLRGKTQAVVEDHIVRINPKYDTKILETPSYLLNFIPTAAMTMFDTLTDNPFNVFFVTTDEKRSPASSIPDIFQMVVHEEYGHCVNFSNSALSFGSSPDLVEKLDSALHYPISEGISFHREYETLTLLEELSRKSKEDLSSKEQELFDTLEKHRDLKSFLLESRFVIYKWRIIRFLRAVGDVRTNLNKQSLSEFVEWASEKTGFGKQTIYDQLFIFQENPGYAPCYSIAGMSLRGIQEEARKNGKDIIEFNTVASSLGFPPRTVFEERLRSL
jgi:hypothetical protein